MDAIAEAGIALGHRRLAIVDLSPTGVQPMASADGRFVITYNGELYNTAEMAADLAMPLRGTSDTEVLVEWLAKFGIEATLAKANGIFAFGAFDRTTRTLHLARDRMGVKPLYWTRQGGTFAFASELKALRAVTSLSFALDLESLSLYLRHACVPAPRTIYRAVHKLMPGERLEVTAVGETAKLYWDLGAVARMGQSRLDTRSEAEIVEELDGLLADSVKRQMVSDVPLGAFLSGGIDSSTVVALMQRAGRGRVKTFSIGFSEDAFNEADHARAVAQHLATDHTELVLSAADAQAIIPQLPAIYDEPFADVVPASDLSGVAAGAQQGDGRAVRRWRRRIVRWLCALSGRVANVAGDAPDAARRSPAGCRRGRRSVAGTLGCAGGAGPAAAAAGAFRRQDGEGRAASFRQWSGRHVPPGDFPMARSAKPVANDAGAAGLGRRHRAEAQINSMRSGNSVCSICSAICPTTS